MSGWAAMKKNSINASQNGEAVLIYNRDANVEMCSLEMCCASALFPR